MATQRTACSDQSPGKPSAKRAKHARVTATSPSVQSTTTCAEEVCKLVGSGDGSPENAQESSKVDASKQAEVIEPAEEAVEAAEGCSNCTVLSNKLRKLKNRIVSLEEKAKKWKASNRRSHYRIKVNEEHFQQLDAETEKAARSEGGGNDAEGGYSGEGDVAEEEEEDYEEEMEVAEEEEEDDDASEYDTATETETDTTETETEEEHGDKLNR